MNRLRKTVATWPKGGEGWFYTDVSSPEEAEVVVNFILNRDYNAAGVVLRTSPLRRSDANGVPIDVYYLAGLTVRSRALRTK